MALPILRCTGRWPTAAEEHTRGDYPRHSYSSSAAHTLVGSEAGQPGLEPDTGVRDPHNPRAGRRSIAICRSSRSSLSHRLSQSSHHTVPPLGATSPTLPIATRPRFHSVLSFRSDSSHLRSAASTDLTIRLSVDASRSRSYRRLLDGSAVMAALRVLEDECQRPVPAAHAAVEKRLVGLYFAAAWSADCDDFRSLLLGVSSAHGDDFVVVHVSADSHPADMAQTMAGTGWLCVPWREHRLRQDLMESLGVVPAELPRLVVVDGYTHRVVSAAGRPDVERRPLTCVREWKRSRSGDTWGRLKPWLLGGLALLVALFVVLPVYL
ncbi:hypothetical protein H4R21_004600 [Coemansia helicoidea]|uniref:Uncharacterized protein n=1 Tax=Coemansia helicoidea TaxID=1286919 RepID=A0ACC1KXA7_9FUNG|nr:hypothetical protein H4R21_004600 [Coemansia helicoidea]